MDPESSAEYTGETIERRMDELGLNLGDLAKRAGVSTKTINKLLRCQVETYQPKKLAAISVALGWPPDALRKSLAGDGVEAYGPQGFHDPAPPPPPRYPMPPLPRGADVDRAIRELEVLAARAA